MRDKLIGVMYVRVSLLLIVCAVVLTVCQAPSSFAARPLYTEDCWVVSFGHGAVESGVLLLSNRDNTGKREIVTSIKYGLSPNVDVSFDLPYVSSGSYSSNYDGLADGTVKVKYNPYLSEDKCEGLSFLVGYMVDTADPTNKADLANNHHHVIPMLIYSKDLGDLSFHLNFAYTYDNAPPGDDAQDFIIYNASVIKPLNDKVNIMAENQYSRDTLNWTIVDEIAVGFNYMYSDKLIFDSAIGCGLTENSSSSNFSFGLTYLFI